MDYDSDNSSENKKLSQIRKRKKYKNEVFKSEIWDNMIKYKETQCFKVIKENNQDLNDSNLVLGAITDIIIFNKIILDKNMW